MTQQEEPNPKSRKIEALVYDGTLDCRGENIEVCKEALCKASEHFRAMFTKDFKEKNTNHFEVDEDVKDMRKLLEYIYGDMSISHINDEDVPTFYRLADMWIMDDVKRRLDSKIVCHSTNHKSNEILFKWLIACVTYNAATMTLKYCEPAAACMPLEHLELHKNELGAERTLKLVTAKLKAVYSDTEDAVKRFRYRGITNIGYNYMCTKCKGGVYWLSEKYEECICARKRYETYFDDEKRKESQKKMKNWGPRRRPVIRMFSAPSKNSTFNADVAGTSNM